MSRRRASIIVIVLVLILALVAGYWWWNRKRERSVTNGDPAPIATWTPTPHQSATTSPTTSGSPRPRASAIRPVTPVSAPSGCSSVGRPIVPTTLTIDRQGTRAPVLSLGLDENGAAKAPPKDASHTTAWFNQGPKPGSSAGKVIITAHTYHANDNALGNELYKTKPLKPGDVLRFSDSEGRTMCYRFSKSLKVLAKTYDPASGLIYDNTGAPQVVIVICWDYNWDTTIWDSRILFYATPLFATA